MEINVLIEDGIESGQEPEWLQTVMERVLLAENAPDEIEISLVITGQERIQELNREYRGLDSPTDVLSFAMSESAMSQHAMSEQKQEQEQVEFLEPPDGRTHLGEIIISYPQAVLQAAETGHSIKKEMAVLIVHGVLHILGYDHEIPEKEPAMTAREKEILAELEKELI